MNIKKLIKKFAFGVYVKLHGLMIYISIALHNTENDILKANPIITDEKDKKIQRKRHRNQVLEKFYAGQRDEKYVQDFYEILKKADSFIRDSKPHKIAMAADKHIRISDCQYSEENPLIVNDKYGRRYAHFGFFDEKHKHSGKTITEVINIEKNERRTTDDDYELIYIFNNKPYELGIMDLSDIIDETGDGSENKFIVKDVHEVAKKYKFPIKVYREDENVLNKIEQITEFLHVKKIGFNFRLLEFFIPLHFNIKNVDENSQIYNELINIKNVFVKDEYGKLIGFSVNKLTKRITYKDTHEVWKFEAIEMETVSAK